MFRITYDPSSGCDNLCLIEITYNGSIVLIMCLLGVWQHILDLWCVCVCAATQRTHTAVYMGSSLGKWDCLTPQDGTGWLSRNFDE